MIEGSRPHTRYEYHGPQPAGVASTSFVVPNNASLVGVKLFGAGRPSAVWRWV